MKNVFEAADTRQKQVKKRSLCLINEHFEPVFNTAAATQIVFQQPVEGYSTTISESVLCSNTHKRRIKSEAPANPLTMSRIKAMLQSIRIEKIVV